MPSLISLNRSAFVEGTKIGVNVMLSQEVVKGYRRNTLTPRSSSIADIMKAFDSVERKFLFNVLMAMDFPT